MGINRATSAANATPTGGGASSSGVATPARPRDAVRRASGSRTEPRPAFRPEPAEIIHVGHQLTTGVEGLRDRALRAHARLYRLIDADEPDLGANITFMSGRMRLLRLGQRPLDSAALVAAHAYIAAAESVCDEASAWEWFTTFADELIRQLDRSGGDTPAT